MRPQQWVPSVLLTMVLGGTALPVLADHDDEDDYRHYPGHSALYDRHGRPVYVKVKPRKPKKVVYYYTEPVVVERVVYREVPVYRAPPMYREPPPRRYSGAPNTLGTVAGAVVGAAVGSRFGKGDGRTAAIAIGSVVGGHIGGQW